MDAFDDKFRPPAQATHFLHVEKRLLKGMQPQQREAKGAEAGAYFSTQGLGHIPDKVVHQGTAIRFEHPVHFGQAFFQWRSEPMETLRSMVSLAQPPGVRCSAPVRVI